MSYSEFKEWVDQNPLVMRVFDDTFHQDLWNSTYCEPTERRTSNLPTMTEIPTSLKSLKESRYSERTFSFKDEEIFCKRLGSFQSTSNIQIAGKLYKKENSSWNAKYAELRGSFLVYFSNKEQKYCEGMLLLDGCHVECLNNLHKNVKPQKYGFKISYPREGYKPYFFSCPDKLSYDEWMDHLKIFQNVSIKDMYNIHEQIGTGQFSTVFRGTSKIEDYKEIAIKIIDKEKLTATEKQSILSETSVMKVLDHSTTIKLFETFDIQNKLYIIMELVKDGDLFDYILDKEFVEEYEASFLMQRLLTSVAYLHNHGIVHRDLKPENIMITRESDAEHTIKEIKLIDFGFSKFISSNDLIMDACGTPNYLAPEILKESGYDKKVDVFSLGVIMYFLLRGYLPFDASNVGEILKKTYIQDAPMDDEHWDKISPEGKDLLNKMLQKDPNERIELEEALKHPWIQQRENLKRYEGVNPRARKNKGDKTFELCTFKSN